MIRIFHINFEYLLFARVFYILIDSDNTRVNRLYSNCIIYTDNVKI